MIATMTRSLSGFAAAALLFVIGCGGSGGSDPDPDPTLTDRRIEAVTGAGIVVDGNNLQVGDALDMRIWGRDESGNIGLESATNWRTNAPSSVATVSSTGRLSIAGATSTAYSITGGGLTWEFRVSANRGRITGLVRNTERLGVPRATVRLYDSSQNVVGSALSGSNGTFRVLVPTSARRFLVENDLISDRYAPIFGYGPLHEYGPACAFSRWPETPTVASGTTVALPSNAVLYRRPAPGEPPLPPPDCGL
jgi:hypothetical protein